MVSAQKVKWMSFQDALEASEKSPRKIFIDVYTDWCGWCKEMDKHTFTDTAIVRILNEKYYPVKLDAESKKTFKYFEHTFKYKPEFRANELAVALLNGEMGYPSLVFLNEERKVLTKIPGAHKPEGLKPILLFLHGGHYNTKSFDEYLKSYNDSISHKTIAK